jgi:mRNA interferase YafQ
MLTPVRSKRFKKDVELARKRGWELSKLTEVLDSLLKEESLPARCQDHPLQGEWQGFRDVHIAPDWLLIYAVLDGELHLARTGTHADLFG